MIEDCSLRAFEVHDLPRLHEIRAAAYLPVFESFRRIVGVEIAAVALAHAEREQAALLDRICGSTSSHEMFVVEYGAEIIGFCALTVDRETEVGEIDLNAVHPNYQGRGVGSWMYEQALSKLRASGMRIATVGAGGDPSHAAARRAYEKAGFGPAIPSVHLYRLL